MTTESLAALLESARGNVSRDNYTVEHFVNMGENRGKIRLSIYAAMMWTELYFSEKKDFDIQGISFYTPCIQAIVPKPTVPFSTSPLTCRCSNGDMGNFAISRIPVLFGWLIEGICHQWARSRHATSTRSAMRPGWNWKYRIPPRKRKVSPCFHSSSALLRYAKNTLRRAVAAMLVSAEYSRL